MAAIRFYKMEASGNDFIVVDNRTRTIRDIKAFSRLICKPHTGVGADGALFIEPSKKADFALRIINLDGSEAEACGNGYRCVSRFANEVLGFGKTMTFETEAGNILAEIKNHLIKIQMTSPSALEQGVHIQVAGRNFEMSTINTGVPHAVIMTNQLDKTPVYEWGRAIRQHSHFKPKGTNVNFVQVTGKNQLAVRTYERGVEGETLACGTGATAVAVIAVLQKKVGAPVKVKTKSGEVVQIYLAFTGDKLDRVFFRGECAICF